MSWTLLAGKRLKEVILTAILPGCPICHSFLHRHEAREILNLTWEKVDLRNRVIRLEAEDTKDSEARTIPEGWVSLLMKNHACSRCFIGQQGILDCWEKDKEKGHKVLVWVSLKRREGKENPMALFGIGVRGRGSFASQTFVWCAERKLSR